MTKINYRRDRRKLGVDMSNEESNLHIVGCEREDVIAFGKQMYKVEHIASAFARQIGAIANSINAVINKSDGFTIPNQTFAGGHVCEVLSAHSKGWKKGKVKIKFELEFIPDKVEVVQEDQSARSDSSLDSLRAVVEEN